MKIFDLIVVGGGPIGLFLSSLFRKRGFEVLVLEKRKNLEVPKPCSSLVSENFFQFLPKDLSFFEKEFSKARIWVSNSFFDFNGKAYLLNRKELEKFLLENAKKTGVLVRFSSEVQKIKENKDFVEVFLEKESFRAKVVAGCDGALSRVGKEIGFFHKTFLFGAVTYLKEDRRGDFPELFFQKKFPKFFAWRIPRKERVEWGVALEPKYLPKERLKNWLLDTFGSKEMQFFGAPIPLSPLKKFVSKRVFLCGDSAGHVKVYTGGGLVYGMFAAKLASKIVDPDFPNLHLFEKELWRKMRSEFFFGRLIKISYSFPDFIKKIALLFLSKLNRKKLFDQDRPTSIFKKLPLHFNKSDIK